MLDRLSITYVAAPMRGHRTYTDIPPFRRASCTPVQATIASAVEAGGAKDRRHV